jgi:hypothetical protein
LAIELNNPTRLLVVSNESASDVLTLSPGQQVLPSRYGPGVVSICFEFLIIYAAQDCVSPNVLKVRDRPKAQLFSITNTSVILKWMPPPLEEHCDDRVINYPPLIYGISVSYAGVPLLGFPIVSNLVF